MNELLDGLEDGHVTATAKCTPLLNADGDWEGDCNYTTTYRVDGKVASRSSGVLNDIGSLPYECDYRSSVEPTHSEETDDLLVEVLAASTLPECLNACAVGGARIIAFCRGMEDARTAALCYAAAAAGEVACAGFCYNNVDGY